MRITDYNEINVDSNNNTQNSQPRKILRESPIKVNNPNMNSNIRPTLRSRGSNESNIEGDKSYQTNSSDNSNAMSNQNHIMDDSVNLSMKLQRFMDSRKGSKISGAKVNQIMAKDKQNIAVCSQGANIKNKAYDYNSILGPNNFSNENSIYTSGNKIQHKNRIQKNEFMRSENIKYQNESINMNVLTKLDKTKINLNGLDVMNNDNSQGIDDKPPINTKNYNKPIIRSKKSIESSGVLFNNNQNYSNFDNNLGIDNTSRSREKVDVSNISPINLTSNSVRSDFLVDSQFNKKNNDKKNSSFLDKNDSNNQMNNINYNFEEDQVIFDQCDMQNTNEIQNNDFYYNENNIPIKEADSPKSRSEVINARESNDKFNHNSKNFNKNGFCNVQKSKNISNKDTTAHSTDITLPDFMGSNMSKGTENTYYHTRTNSKDMTLNNNLSNCKSYKQSKRENLRYSIDYADCHNS